MVEVTAGDKRAYRSLEREDMMKSKWHRPMYSKMHQSLWFIVFGYLVMINFHFDYFMFKKIGENDYKFGLIRITKHV
jgi:hypothetical protein